MSISMQPHPNDPGPSGQPQASTPPPPPPSTSTTRAFTSDLDPPPPPPPPEANVDPNSNPPVPVPPRFDRTEDAGLSSLPSSQQTANGSSGNPPFDTYRFFVELEKAFPTPTARNLMRATRALLEDKLGRVKREGLTVKDLEAVRRTCVLLLQAVADFGLVASKRICSRQHCRNCVQS